MPATRVVWCRRGGDLGGWAAALATALLCVLVAANLGAKLLLLPERPLGALDWIVLAAVAGAVAMRLWSPKARHVLAGLYVVGLAAVGMEQIVRFQPGRFYIWACAAEWSGFVLVAAAAGWLLPRTHRIGRVLRIPNQPGRWATAWFGPAQAILAAVTAALAAWIAMDFAFDGVGRGVALFGLVGRVDGCPTALMLVGTSILMAWQTHGRWRAGWQYAAMAAGVLFTSSIGWAHIDSSASSAIWVRWYDRSLTLLLSSSTMTLLTGVGLPRVLPRRSDWIVRGRYAMRYFAALAILMLAVAGMLAIAAR